jgi:hypothetical protein
MFQWVMSGLVLIVYECAQNSVFWCHFLPPCKVLRTAKGFELVQMIIRDKARAATGAMEVWWAAWLIWFGGCGEDGGCGRAGVVVVQGLGSRRYASNGIAFTIRRICSTSASCAMAAIGSRVSSLVERRAAARNQLTNVYRYSHCHVYTKIAAHEFSVVLESSTCLAASSAPDTSMDFVGQLPGLPYRLTRLYSDSKHSADAVTEQEDDVPELISLLRKFRIQKDRYIAWGLEVCIT